MEKTRIRLFLLLMLGIFLLISSKSFAAASAPAPQPTSCVTGTFASTGNAWWQNITLTIKNTCSQSADLQNSNITFSSTTNLSQPNFWLTKYKPLSYPDNSLVMSLQPLMNGNYTASLLLHFPTNSVLASGGSLVINYGDNTASYVPGTVKVYLSGNQQVQTGEIDLTNSSAQPSTVTQNYAVVDIVSGGQVINSIQLPWGGQKPVTGLVPGSYTIQPENITDTQGNTYTGNAVPTTVSLSANQKIPVAIGYTQIVPSGQINIAVAKLPAALTGYTNTPVVSVTQVVTGATTKTSVQWNATTTLNQLVNNAVYSFSTPVISYNGNNCTPTFNPLTLTSNATSIPITQLSYICVPVVQDQVTLNVTGLPGTATSVNVVFTPADGSSPVTQAVSVTNGSGTATVNLTDGLIYSLSASKVAGYAAAFNPQSLTVTNAATETVTYQRQSGGRIIGYLPGWITPPTAVDLANAGYTHVLVAFGVFSTSQPGQIVSAFSTVSKDYITALHNAGIKVLLSLGGASTSIGGTSVNFDQVVQLAASTTAFRDAFVSSVENFVATYGFDGVDFDIEQGLNVGGTFAQPTGDVALLATIINKLHMDNANLLISLAPQVDNIAATSGFDGTWGNYAALVMQTYKALSWVGIQLYNTGCAYGLNQFCYDPYTTASPDFSVAMADDLLTSWPSVDKTGRLTGFQPYVSYLNPDQIVLGYPVVNSAGQSDGSPATPIATIKRAIQCLRTATAGANSCDSYLPTTAYPEIGGVFDWEIIHDQSNSYQFAKGLSACVLNNNCS